MNLMVVMALVMGFIVWELVSIEKRLQRIVSLLEEQQRRRPPVDNRFY